MTKQKPLSFAVSGLVPSDAREQQLAARRAWLVCNATHLPAGVARDRCGEDGVAAVRRNTTIYRRNNTSHSTVFIWGRNFLATTAP